MADDAGLTTGEANEEGQGGFSYCSVPAVIERDFSSDVSPPRMALIQVLDKKWLNGTVLHYYFFNEDADGEWVQFTDGTREFRTWVGPEEQREVVRQGFKAWKDLGVGLVFEEVQSRDDAEIRIGFMRGDGAWSYVGRDLIDLGLSVNERTMNFGWDLTRRADEVDTAIHEIGHTLGFPHEHQNPNAGIVWDEEAVYRALAQPPNRWDRKKTFHNIIRKIPVDTVQGSNWDPDSVMHYPFGAGMIKEPAKYKNGLRPAGGLSERDKTWVRTFYPPIRGRTPELKLFNPVFLGIEPGVQKNLAITPSATRRFTIQTFGISDTVMVLFEDINDNLRYVSGDDDSGTVNNAKINVKLFRGREYLLRVRLYYSGGAGKTAVMMW